MTPEIFRAAANVSRETLDRLILYADCLTRWQKRINLVGPATIPDLWNRHILDSAQLVPLIPGGARTVTDIGSGAGFPGLVIAVMTGLDTHLIESDARKAAFLREAIRLTRANATVHDGRAERIEPWPSDVVTARAVAPLDNLLELASHYLSQGAGSTPVCLFPKGAAWQEELTAARKTWHMQVESAKSITDPQGRVLILTDIYPLRSAQARSR